MKEDQFRFRLDKFAKIYGEEIKEERTKELFQKFEKIEYERFDKILTFIEDCDVYFPKNPWARFKEVEKHLYTTNQLKEEIKREIEEKTPLAKKALYDFCKNFQTVQKRLVDPDDKTIRKGSGNMKSMAEVLLQYFNEAHIVPAKKYKEFLKK